MSERGGYPAGTGGHVGVRLDTIIQEDPGEPQDKEDDESRCYGRERDLTGHRRDCGRVGTETSEEVDLLLSTTTLGSDGLRVGTWKTKRRRSLYHVPTYCYHVRYRLRQKKTKIKFPNWRTDLCGQELHFSTLPGPM